MAGEVKIKDVGSESIWMKTAIINRPVWGIKVIYTAAIAIVILALISILIPYHFLVLTTISSLVMAYGMVIVFNPGVEHIPAYRVYIHERDTEIVVPKTTTIELDQDAVCEAVNKLVPKAREFSNEVEEMKKIAWHCR